MSSQSPMTQPKLDQIFTKTSFTPKAPIKAVLWDVDGTLVNSEPLFVHAIQVILKDLNIIMTEKQEAEWAGQTLEDSYNYLVNHFNITKPSWPEFKNDVMSYVRDNFEKAPLMEECLVDILNNLHDKGLRQAVVSNGQKELVERSANRVGLHFFEFSLGIEDTKTGKPSPTPYLMAAKKMDIKPENCLVIEDSATGVMSGLAAGMNVIARPSNKTYLKENLKTFKQAHLLIEKLSDVNWEKIL